MIYFIAFGNIVNNNFFFTQPIRRYNEWNMLAYIDEYGNITSTPPDPSRKIKINVEDIQIGVAKQEDIPYDTVRNGVVSFFNESKGYGFIKDLETQESIFVHINALTEPLKENNMVTFETEQGPKGLSAIKVKKK